MNAKYNGRAGNRRGRAAELRACRLMPDVIDALPWAYSWREATPEEDAGGIDLVVDTDAGEVCLQIKASKRNVRRALDRAWWIGVVVVNEHKTDWHVEADLRETLSGQRALHIAASCKED